MIYTINKLERNQIKSIYRFKMKHNVWALIINMVFNNIL